MAVSRVLVRSAKMTRKLKISRGGEIGGGFGGARPPKLILGPLTLTQKGKKQQVGGGGPYMYLLFLPVIVHITLRFGEEVDPPDCCFIFVIV